MVMRERINYSIIEILEKYKTRLAFPIQRVIIENNSDHLDFEK
jgi:hypothetical protein